MLFLLSSLLNGRFFLIESIQLSRINISIKDGSFHSNKVLSNAFEYADKNQKRVHFMGLISNGGVHSHQEARPPGETGVLRGSHGAGRETQDHGGGPTLRPRHAARAVRDGDGDGQGAAL